MNNLFRIGPVASVPRAATMLSLLLAGVTCGFGAPVDLTLGLSSQPVSETGLGGDGSGNGFINFNLGTCAGATCTLSGSYTGDATGYMSGTYSVVTQYSGATTVLGGEVLNAAGGNNQFTLTSAPGTITLYLDDSSGQDYTIPIFDGTNFDVQSFNVQYATSGVTCTGTSNCSVGGVSLVNGATITGPVTGALTFDTSVSTPTGPGTGPGGPPAAAPEPAQLLLSGVGLLGLACLRRRILPKNR